MWRLHLLMLWLMPELLQTEPLAERFSPDV
jgi:hypothetical protein